jgi:hypothetical protein
LNNLDEKRAEIKSRLQDHILIIARPEKELEKKSRGKKKQAR